MEDRQLKWIANVIRDLYVRGKSRDVVLPMPVRYETATSGQRSFAPKLVVDADVPVLIRWATDVP